MDCRWLALVFTWLALAGCRPAPERDAAERTAQTIQESGGVASAVAPSVSAESGRASPVAGAAHRELAESAGGEGPASREASSVSSVSSDDTFTGTAGILEDQRESYPRLLRAVRAARHGHYDRTVFEFADGIPGYHLEYVDRPVRDCGAGDTRQIEGDGWLEVRFYPANAHTEEGRATVAQRELRPELPIVREIERTCDFEAVVTWVIGTSSPNRYRVLELASPPRFVVDILH